MPDGLNLSLVRLHLLVVAGLHFELLMEHLGSVVMRVALLRLIDEEEEKERGAEQQQSGLDVNMEVVDGRSVRHRRDLQARHKIAIQTAEKILKNKNYSNRIEIYYLDDVPQEVNPKIFNRKQLHLHRLYSITDLQGSQTNQPRTCIYLLLYSVSLPI